MVIPHKKTTSVEVVSSLRQLAKTGFYAHPRLLVTLAMADFVASYQDV
ncbi:hypothetical protein KJZ67_00285 [Patescibacteria group bacterium]|nr:hypothetical protein [Patescibacteria group bacterium]